MEISRGLKISSTRGRIAEGSAINLFMGYEGYCMDYRNKDILG